MSVIELGTGLVYPDGETPGAFLYAPAAPGIATGPDGRAQVNLLTAGPANFLQVTGRWGLTEAEVETLRAELAVALDVPPATLQLHPLPETVYGAALLICTDGDGEGEGEGAFTELQRAKPSGVPPNHAVFNLMLTGDALEAAKTGLEGTRGRLALRYEGTRHFPVTTTASAEEHSASTGGSAHESGTWQSSKLHSMVAESRHVTFSDDPFSALLDAADWPRAGGRAPT